MTRWMMIAATALSAVCHAGTWPVPQSANPHVQAAHRQYLAGDYAGLAQAVKEGLSSSAGDPAATTNLLDLLDRAFEVNGGTALPTGFKLPASVRRLSVSVKRGEHAGDGTVWHRLDVSGEVLPNAVENIRVERFPNQVVLDRSAGVGEWEEKTVGSAVELWAAGECGPTPVPDGLYLIEVKVRNEQPVKGWFALNRHTSSASPYVTTPTCGESSVSATPTFRWEEFRSPENLSWERRSVRLLLFDRSTHQVVWSSSCGTGEQREALVGRDGEGPASLTAGGYALWLGFSESRRFGDLLVARESGTRVTFSVGR